MPNMIIEILKKLMILLMIQFRKGKLIYNGIVKNGIV
jgi:hypothetical protein